MGEFIITYLGDKPPTSPEEGKAHFAKYQQWLGALGESVLSPAKPLKNTHTLSPNGRLISGGTTTMSGYSIIEADPMDSALEAEETCSFLKIGGSLEASELIKMSF